VQVIVIILQSLVMSHLQGSKSFFDIMYYTMFQKMSHLWLAI